MLKSCYDKFPATATDGALWKGWEAVLGCLKDRAASFSGKAPFILVVECYHGVCHDELKKHLSCLGGLLVDVGTLYKPAEDVAAMTHSHLTDDPLFGRCASLSYEDYLDADKVSGFRHQLESASGLVIVYGNGASVVSPEWDLLVYADMARWEIQQRFRRKEINGLGVENKDEKPSLHYKRGYFIDWNICDSLKKQLLPKVDFWLDTHQPENPKMIDGKTLLAGLDKTVKSPFRVVPFFDPAPWGGQWMKEVCGLDQSKPNYGWCFDCVPEENSLYLKVEGELFEMPSNNLVFYKTRDLLGAPVEARFGQNFPIRFDFLDTMGGKSLSLQVHPTTQFARDSFGIPYTQDESYYIIDAEEGAEVYLGLKTGVDPDEMLGALREAQETGKPFNAEKYANNWPARKHDHFLIPAGTVHCSRTGAMVLEISSTPNLFTFKLWDWGQLGLDGRPRPINIERGSKVIEWDRQTELIKKEFINNIQVVGEGDGWIEERTGLHETEFIETRRHWFTGVVPHHTGGGVNVFNVIEGDELVVESPDGAFEPFVVHYAETFIIPASIGSYTIRPSGPSVGKKCGTIKAYVRFKQ